MPNPRKFTKKQIEAVWKSDKVHPEALRRKRQCVLTHCNKKQAVDLAHWFVNTLYPVPACTHYDGNTLCLYCGDAGAESGKLVQAATKHAMEVLGKGE